MPVPPAPELLDGLRRTLSAQGIDYKEEIRQFGQVAASESRLRGDRCSLADHVRGLILSQLSNQRPWHPIAANLERIQAIFFDYDPDTLQRTEPEVLTEALQSLRCGNRAIHKQMQALAGNIHMLRQIELKYGSMDNFVVSAEPHVVAKRLANSGPYKLRQVGFTLALEYLRNVGIRAAKPDVHVCRVISAERLGYAQATPVDPQDAYELLRDLAAQADCNATYLDNLLWMFCATGYGAICGATPKCQICAFRQNCNYPRQHAPSQMPHVR